MIDKMVLVGESLTSVNPKSATASVLTVSSSNTMDLSAPAGASLTEVTVTFTVAVSGTPPDVTV